MSAALAQVPIGVLIEVKVDPLHVGLSDRKLDDDFTVRRDDHARAVLRG